MQVSARSAGLGGQQATLRGAAQGALMNPAALGAAEHPELVVSGGGEGHDSALAAIALGIPLDSELGLGLDWSTLSQRSAPGYQEHSLGLTAGLAVSRRLSMGIRFNYQQVVTRGQALNGGRGGTLDAGAQYRWPVAGAEIVAGLQGRSLAGAWQDKSWQRAVPLGLEAGLAIEKKDLGWLGVALDRQGSSSTGQDHWRAGVAWQALRWAELDAGASDQADRAYSTGLALNIPGRSGELRYSLQFSQDSSRLTHRLAWQTVFGLSSKPVAAVLQMTYEPGTKRVRSAKIAVKPDDKGGQGKAWELEIRDKDGRVIRVLRGEGLPPAFVNWDGKDALGQVVDDGDQVSFRLAIRPGSRMTASQRPWSVSSGLSPDGLSALAVSATSSPLMVPMQDGKGSTQLLIRPQSNDAAQASRWEVVLTDASGQVARRLEGVGPLPDDLLIQQAGDKQDLSGLRVKVNVVSKSGLVLSLGQTTFEGLEPLAEDWDMATGPSEAFEIQVPAVRVAGIQFAMAISVPSFERLPEEETKIALAPASSPLPTLLPTLPATAVPTPLATEAPTAIPVLHATAVLSPQATALPTLPATMVPTPQATAIPTLHATPIPTAVAIVRILPSAEPALSVSAPVLVAGLQTARFTGDPNAILPAELTRAEVDALFPPVLARPGAAGRPRRGVSGIATLLDVFEADSSDIDLTRQADKLQAFYWRLKSYRKRRLLLTGLVKKGERGGEALARQRARELSRRMVVEGEFEGEFILTIDAIPGDQKGVRVEALSR